jgi:hypothetical protein
LQGGLQQSKRGDNMAATSQQFTVTITEQERDFLLSHLEQTLEDTHAEARRTESPAYQQVVHEQEALLRSLVNKVRDSAA